MIRSSHQFVICAALLTLFFSIAAVHVQASASPHEMHDEVNRESVSVDTLRAAKPIFDGGFVPEPITSRQPVAVDVLRAAKPVFDGGFVPEPITSRQPVAVDVLRAAKPIFDGGFVPEPMVSQLPVLVDVLRAARPVFDGGFVPEPMVSRDSVRTVPDQDDPVADMPKSTMEGSLEQLLGLLKTPEVDK